MFSRLASMKPSAALACPRPSGDAAAARCSSGCQAPSAAPARARPTRGRLSTRAGAAARLRVPWLRPRDGLEVSLRLASMRPSAALACPRPPGDGRGRATLAAALSSSKGSLLREVALRGRSANARRRAAAKAVRLSVPRRADWCSSASEQGRGRSLGDVSTALYGVGEHGLRAEPWARFAVPGSRACT